MRLALRTPIGPCRSLIKVKDRVRGKWAGSRRQCSLNCSEDKQETSIQFQSIVMVPNGLSKSGQESEEAESFLHQQIAPEADGECTSE